MILPLHHSLVHGSYDSYVQVQAHSTLIWKGGDSLLKCRPHCDWTIYLIDLFS